MSRQHSSKRVGSAYSILSANPRARHVHVSGTVIHRTGRPTSARVWFEANNQKKNEDAWKQEELQATVDFLKKREWQTKYFNSLSRPQREDLELTWKDREEKEKQLNEKRSRLRLLIKEDEIMYEKEREERRKNILDSTGYKSVLQPEIEFLKSRLDELKMKNEDERRKMSEFLSYEAWRKNNAGIRQEESQKLDRYLREAWVDQKQWKEDERQRAEEERKKYEMEAERQRRIEEEEECRLQEIRRNKLKDWKTELDNQLKLLKERDLEAMKLMETESALYKEHHRLLQLTERRDKIKDLRKRKNLELFWAKQYQLKLKKKAADIQCELLEDEKIIEDILRGLPRDSSDEEVKQKLVEGEKMKEAIQKQKELEKYLEKEYDLLFSEEAERIWGQRQVEWDKEQYLRDKFMQDTLHSLQNQVADKMAATKRHMEVNKDNKSQLISSIEETQKYLVENEEKEIIKIDPLPNFRRPKNSLETSLTMRDRRLDELQRNLKIEDHRKEIAHLENEMKKLWEGSYVPPQYGRKKVTW